jgi:hypothetical protein
MMENSKEEFEGIWSREETKAWQESRDRKIVEGDRNTAYFLAVANQRRKKKNLAVKDGRDGPVDTTNKMLRIVPEFCKNLFSEDDRPDISLDYDSGTRWISSLMRRLPNLILLFQKRKFILPSRDRILLVLQVHMGSPFFL